MTRLASITMAAMLRSLEAQERQDMVHTKLPRLMVIIAAHSLVLPCRSSATTLPLPAPMHLYPSLLLLSTATTTLMLPLSQVLLALVLRTLMLLQSVKPSSRIPQRSWLKLPVLSHPKHTRTLRSTAEI